MIQRVLILSSPGTEASAILPDLETLIPADHGIEVVLVCNRKEGQEYDCDFDLEQWALDRGNLCTVGFASSLAAVDYVKGHRLFAFTGDRVGRCGPAIERARRYRKWWQKPYKHYRPKGRWRDQRIRVSQYYTGA